LWKKLTAAALAVAALTYSFKGGGTGGGESYSTAVVDLTKYSRLLVENDLNPTCTDEMLEDFAAGHYNTYVNPPFQERMVIWYFNWNIDDETPNYTQAEFCNACAGSLFKSTGNSFECTPYIKA